MGKGKPTITDDEMLERMAKHEAGHLLLGWLCDLTPDVCEINVSDSTTGTWSADREQDYPVIGILTDLAGMVFNGELRRIQELEMNIDSPEHYADNEDESKIVSRIQAFDGDHREVIRAFCKVLLDVADIFLPIHEEAVQALLKYRRLDSQQCQMLYRRWDSICKKKDPERPHSDYFCRNLAEYMGLELPEDGYIGWDLKPIPRIPDDLPKELSWLGELIGQKGKKAPKKGGNDRMKKTTTSAKKLAAASRRYLLRVSFDDFDDVYADIEASDATTYEQLHDRIFEAFDRWEEHLYMFTLPDGTEVVSPYDEGEDGGKPADKCRLGKSLKVGEIIDYLFDFGDSWEHTIEVKEIKEPESNVKYPRIVEVHGDVPPQYPEDEDYDEDYDEDFDEDFEEEDGGETPKGGK